MFKIYGDYGYTTENLLEEFDTYEEAERWVEGYIRWGDFGGYDVIEIAFFDEHGEYIMERRYDKEDFYEGDDDFALMEDF